MRDVIDEPSFIAGLAEAVQRLAYTEVPGKAAYDNVVQRAYNHFVLRTLTAEGYRTPGSVPEMIDIIAGTPVREWLPGSESEAVLLHDDTRSPTQECAELIVGNKIDPMGEKFEHQVIGQVLDACREARSPESYVAFRRLLIGRPTLTQAEQVAEFGRLELMPVRDILADCYVHAPAHLRRGGEYAQCARCGCLLRPVREDEWRCDLDRCRTTKTKVGRLIDASTPGGVFHLKLPLRTFITGPGLFEIELERAMLKRGLDVEMWPEYDTYDLLITFPDHARWAVDVKDYANPGMLGRRFTDIPQSPPRDRAFLVVPDYRYTADKQYVERFRTARDASGRGGRPVNLQFIKKFLREADRKRQQLASKEEKGNA